MHRTAVAAGFYVSATFWIGVVAVVFAGLTLWMAWLQFRKKEPHRELRVFAPAPIAVVAASDPRGRLKVRWDDEELCAPFIQSIILKNTGTRDIGVQDFDGGHPLKFTVGTRIVEVLDLEGQPAPLEVESDYETVVIRQRLIRVGHSIRVRLLCDGQPKVVMREEALRDTNVEVVRMDTDTLEAYEARLADSRRTMNLNLRILAATLALIILCPTVLWLVEAK